MLPGLVIAALASCPLGLGAAAGLARRRGRASLPASRQRAVGADVAVAVTVTTPVRARHAARPLARRPGPARRAPLRRPARRLGRRPRRRRPRSPSSRSSRSPRGHRSLTLSGFDPQTARSLGGGNQRATALAARPARADGPDRRAGRSATCSSSRSWSAPAPRRCGWPAAWPARSRSRPRRAAFAGVAGIYLSYCAELAAGASIAICAVAVFAVAMAVSRLTGRPAAS